MKHVGTVLVMVALALFVGCIRPYDPLTDQPTTLLSGERLYTPAPPVQDPAADYHDRQLDALEKRLGIAPRKGK